MESTATAVPYKESDLKMLRMGSLVLAAAWGLSLVVRLLGVVPRLLNRSPIALADIAYVIAFSIFLIGALASLTPRFLRVLLARQNKWNRKSRGERFRVKGMLVLAAILLGLLPFALIFVEMEGSPGQDLLTYFLGAAPVTMLVYAAITIVTIIWASRQAS